MGLLDKLQTAGSNFTAFGGKNPTKYDGVSEIDTFGDLRTCLQNDTTSVKAKSDAKSPSETISVQFYFLRFVLVPEPNTYTGLALFIDIFKFSGS